MIYKVFIFLVIFLFSFSCLMFQQRNITIVSVLFHFAGFSPATDFLLFYSN